jgi:uncharacterized Tic20 family protein
MHATMPINERGRWVDDTSTTEDRTYSALLHASVLAHTVIPIVSILIPIIMWNMKKKDSPFIADHGREAVNFQISLLLYSLILPIIAIPIGLLLLVVGVAVTVPVALIFPYILGLVGMILAVIACNRGELFRYPMTLRFLKG